MAINFFRGSGQDYVNQFFNRGQPVLSKEDQKLKDRYKSGDKGVSRYVSGYTQPRRIGGGGGNERTSRDPIYGYQTKNSAQAAPVGEAPKTYGNAPSSQGKSSIDFDKQLAAIRSQNQASMDALTQQLADQQADYALKEEAANKKISGLASTVANAQSMYDPTKDMQSSSNINPALSIQEKSKSLNKGTQRYNRSQLSINNLNV